MVTPAQLVFLLWVWCKVSRVAAARFEAAVGTRPQTSGPRLWSS
jgi:hypothetical protein